LDTDTKDSDTITVLFRMGMSGHWAVKPKGEEFYKHAHLRFHVLDKAVGEQKSAKNSKPKAGKKAGKSAATAAAPAAAATAENGNDDGKDDLCLCFIDVRYRLCLGVQGEEKRLLTLISLPSSRRFGSWQVTEDWGDAKERGPDIVTEHAAFKQLIKSSLDAPVFNKAICEVMLDQQYFNGIGNYLRAEILHRADIHPFARARDVLQTALTSKKGW
jgi:formamidopyrimidine-DNA glycosylase